MNTTIINKYTFIRKNMSEDEPKTEEPTTEERCTLESYKCQYKIVKDAINTFFKIYKDETKHYFIGKDMPYYSYYDIYGINFKISCGSHSKKDYIVIVILTNYNRFIDNNLYIELASKDKMLNQLHKKYSINYENINYENLRTMIDELINIGEWIHINTHLLNNNKSKKFLDTQKFVADITFNNVEIINSYYHDKPSIDPRDSLFINLEMYKLKKEIIQKCYSTCFSYTDFRQKLKKYEKIITDYDFIKNIDLFKELIQMYEG